MPRHYLILLSSMGSPTHCGRLHSLVGILDCANGERKWAAPAWWVRINPFFFRLGLSGYFITATGRIKMAGFHYFACGYPVFPTSFKKKRLPFPHQVVLEPLPNASDCMCQDMVLDSLLYSTLSVHLCVCLHMSTTLFWYCTFVLGFLGKCETFNFILWYCFGW